MFLVVKAQKKAKSAFADSWSERKSEVEAQTHTGRSKKKKLPRHKVSPFSDLGP